MLFQLILVTVTVISVNFSYELQPIRQNRGTFWTWRKMYIYFLSLFVTISTYRVIIVFMNNWFTVVFIRNTIIFAIVLCPFSTLARFPMYKHPPRIPIFCHIFSQSISPQVILHHFHSCLFFPYSFLFVPSLSHSQIGNLKLLMNVFAIRIDRVCYWSTEAEVLLGLKSLLHLFQLLLHFS